ncbi:AfsA-related hotdog domain-containing protein [Nocardia sp. NPDC050712]|uniref:AfsA-related hotdog domain-containing protein n=1 Tax=Nocardia sp. NPDC050712 TaxID=3155518 RepID=UPI0033C2B5DF
MTTTAGLAFEQLAPRALAHRRALAEVYVADTAPAGDGGYLAAIQLPRAHSLWFDRLVRYHDPLCAVEAIRQSLLVIGQRHLEVPADAPASLQQLSIEVEDLDAFRDNEREPLEGLVRLRSDEDAAGPGYYRNLSFEATLTIGAARAMTVRGSGITFPRDAYEEFRGLQRAQRPATAPLPPARPLDPALVGRRDPRNVVLADGRDDIPLVIVDQAHPTFFDHPYDHVPGPLLLEAFRQAAVHAATTAGALATPVAAPMAISAEFTGFAELDAELTYWAEFESTADPDDIAVTVCLHQHGTRIGCARVELMPYPTPLPEETNR